VNRLLDGAVSRIETPVSHGKCIAAKGQYSVSFWNWAIANTSDDARRRITKMLMDPRVRSFRIRAALGRRDFTDIYTELPFEPLDGPAPNIAGVYLLNGRVASRERQDKADLGYVGQAAGLRPRHGKAGIAKRLIEHLRIITSLITQRLSGKSSSHDSIEWSRNRRTRDTADKAKLAMTPMHCFFSADNIKEKFYCILSIFPLAPVDDDLHFHIKCLITLAETIDMIYLGTIAALQSSTRNLDTEFCQSLRPDTMPAPPLKGTNRTLSIAQFSQSPLHKTFAQSHIFKWTDEQLETFRDIFRFQREDLYQQQRISVPYVGMWFRLN
jgi:hypothetical protein